MGSNILQVYGLLEYYRVQYWERYKVGQTMAHVDSHLPLEARNESEHVTSTRRYVNYPPHFTPAR